MPTISTTARRKRQLRWGLGAHVAFVFLVGAGAYLGALPFAVQSIHRMADKALHFLLVGGLAFWLVGLWDDARVTAGPIRLPWAVIAPALLAGFEEGMQFFSSRRNADLLDFAADAAGLMVFWWLGRMLLLERDAEPPPTDPGRVVT
ncbi:MAG: VanZ family protein [Polyangiaceae bacterium]